MSETLAAWKATRGQMQKTWSMVAILLAFLLWSALSWLWPAGNR